MIHRIVAPMPFELPVHPRARRRLAHLLEEWKPDVVHVHVGAISPFAWAAADCAVRYELPTVVTVHSIWDAVTLGVYRAFDVVRSWSSWPLVVSTVSEAAAAPIRRAFAGRAEVRVVANGVETEGWRVPPRTCVAALGMGRHAGIHIVAVGRLAPRKQPLVLLRVLRAAQRRLLPRIQMCATVVGDGPARPAMERYLQLHGMRTWVGLVGRLEQAQVLEALASADLFLAPAAREAFGLAALEARIAGVPVIARSGTGVAEFVTSGQEGLLGRTSDELVDAVVRLATDDDLRHRITAHNHATEPSHCAWPTVVHALEQCYARACALVSRDPSPDNSKSHSSRSRHLTL
jgi:glycosyltransferase involved in cell wall biosynthesis